MKFNHRRIIFHSDKIYWRFWIAIRILDLEKFINHLINDGVKEFYLVDLEEKEIIYLSYEGKHYWFFDRSTKIL